MCRDFDGGAELAGAHRHAAASPAGPNCFHDRSASKSLRLSCPSARSCVWTACPLRSTEQPTSLPHNKSSPTIRFLMRRSHALHFAPVPTPAAIVYATRADRRRTTELLEHFEENDPGPPSAEHGPANLTLSFVCTDR